MDQRRAESLKFWGGLAAALVAGGFTVGMIAGSFAKADDFQRHVAEENGRVSALEAVARNTEADVHAFMAQLWRVADTVGAQRVPEPSHLIPTK